MSIFVPGGIKEKYLIVVYLALLYPECFFKPTGRHPHHYCQAYAVFLSEKSILQARF